MDKRYWQAAAEDPGAWPPAQRRSVPVHATIGTRPAGEVAAAVAASGGCRTVKVALGCGEGPDIERVAAARDAVGPHGALRIDAGGDWTPEQAVARLRSLRRYDLEYVQQPCATLEECGLVRRRSGVAVAVDESLCLHSDRDGLARVREHADVAVLRVHPLGGVRAALEVAERLDLPVVVSSTVDTSVGLAAGIALAAALPELPYACGLNPTQVLRHDVVPQPFTTSDGAVTVRTVTPTDESLAAGPRLTTEREQYWLRRLDRARPASDSPL
jgi:O-succinylbenzoate synthase